MNIFNETYQRKLHWEVIDTIINEDGTKEVRNYYNTVVDDCSKLIAVLMSNQARQKGIAFWAVGTGDSSWANDNLPVPQVTNKKLVNETFRKEVLPENITFIDADNKPTTAFTNKLQITMLFKENEALGELREFSLWGGNATPAKDSGIMINHKIHPIIWKTDKMQLQRIIRLTF